jgi:hypothetical protein
VVFAFRQGCIIGLDANWLATQAGVAIRKVSYDIDFLEEFVNVGLSVLQSQYEDDPEDRKELAQLATIFALDLYAFKDPRFRSEMEVRISRLTLIDDAAEFGLRDPGGHRDNGQSLPTLPVLQRKGPYGSTRFVELPIWDDDRKPVIRSLGFGPKIDVEFETSVRDAASGCPEMVIPPFLTGCSRRAYAAIFSFWAGVMPPIPMLGRSLL